ncbi:MAG TPA: hypothetical protein VFO32_03825, partial [Sphingomicrobium sp.]|nr:hypothetical protein [Sphingomicrobium sp.]
MFGLTAALPLGAALAQASAPRPAATQAAKPGPATATAVDPIAPRPEGQQAAEPLAPLPPPPPPVWRPDQARALLNYIYNVGREGLNPYDY